MFKSVLDQLGMRQARFRFSRDLLSAMPVEKIDALLYASARPEAMLDVLRDWGGILEEGNRFDLLIEGYHSAFLAGTDPYLASEVAARTWDKLGTEAALQVCTTLRGELQAIEFSRQGDGFHKGKVAEILDGIERVIAYEEGSDETAESVAETLHDAVRAMVWPRLWQLARIKQNAKIGRMAVLYAAVFRHDVQQSLFAIEYFLTPYEFWLECRIVLDAMTISAETANDLMAQVLVFRIDAALHLHQPEAARVAYSGLLALLAQENDEKAINPAVAASAVGALWCFYRHQAGREDGESEALLAQVLDLRALCRALEASSPAQQQITLLLGHLNEDLGRIDAATGHYRLAASFDPGGYLPTPFWRAASFLISQGHWPEAAAIHQRGALQLWQHYDAPARILPEERYRSGDILPQSAVMLNCDGIGDDLWRIAIFLRLRGLEARYAFVVDDRLQPLLARALPQYRFLTRSRTTGSHAVSIQTFHADRIGVGPAMDSTRITGAILDAIDEYGDLCLSEDVYASCFRQAGAFPFPPHLPLLVPGEAATASVREWLATLPPGRRNIGLSWRTSGLGGLVRNRMHFQIEELGELLGVDGINWIVLQYTVTEAELDRARYRFGVELHRMPGLDLRDDMERITAIGAALDLMVTTPSTIEPVVAATGTPVLSLVSGYYSALQYGIGPDGETDRTMPNITRLSAKRFGTKADILREAVTRLQVL